MKLKLEVVGAGSGRTLQWCGKPVSMTPELVSRLGDAAAGEVVEVSCHWNGELIVDAVHGRVTDLSSDAIGALRRLLDGGDAAGALDRLRELGEERVRARHDLLSFRARALAMSGAPEAETALLALAERPAGSWPEAREVVDAHAALPRERRLAVGARIAAWLRRSGFAMSPDPAWIVESVAETDWDPADVEERVRALIARSALPERFTPLVAGLRRRLPEDDPRRFAIEGEVAAYLRREPPALGRYLAQAGIAGRLPRELSRLWLSPNRSRVPFRPRFVRLDLELLWMMNDLREEHFPGAPRPALVPFWEGTRPGTVLCLYTGTPRPDGDFAVVEVDRERPRTIRVVALSTRELFESLAPWSTAGSA